MTSIDASTTADPAYPLAANLLPPPPVPEKFSFTGSGSEYFRIWIVNLLLTILTLGIYSAWAKVRRMRYFYDSTRLAGTTFEYHGNPVAILKGRVVAVLFFAAYNLAANHSPLMGLLMLSLLMAIGPWLVWKSLQFKLYNSSYRGIRFGFRGRLRRVYLVFLVFPVLALVSGYLLAPFAHQRMKKFQHEESRYGDSHFSFRASVARFYKAYLIGLLVAVAGMVVIGLGFSDLFVSIFRSNAHGAARAEAIGTMALFFLAVYLWTFLLIPIFLTLIQNLVWNNTMLAQHRFKSEIRAGRMIFIMITNIIGILLTLGLFIPFAQIRAMKYRIESMTLVPGSSLDDFIAETQVQVSATGEGAADMLDFDLSL